MKTCEKIKWQKAYMIFVMYFQGFQIIKIEVASRFEKLYQKRGFYSPSSRGVWGYAAHENSKFQCPKMRFPVPWSLSWVQKMMYFQSVWTSNVE